MPYLKKSSSHKRVGKILFIVSKPRIPDFSNYHELHLLKKTTKSIIDNRQLPGYFNVSSPVDRTDIALVAFIK